ncbi:MAG TPA: ECF transporter S component [Acidimicrobiia bacterium]|jgi:energy-coupling factor transport system substrate-specific component
MSNSTRTPRKWTTFQLVFLPVCAALNVGVGAVVGVVKLPIYVDSIGTFIAAALGGWLYGSVAGLLALVLAAVLIAPTAPAYAGTAIVIAILVAVFTRYGFLRSIVPTIIGGLIIGVAAALVSAPVTTYLYGGVSLVGSDAATAFFKAMGNTILESVIFGGLATDPVDKLLTALITLGILKALPGRLFQRFRNGHRFAERVTPKDAS